MPHLLVPPTLCTTWFVTERANREHSWILVCTTVTVVEDLLRTTSVIPLNLASHTSTLPIIVMPIRCFKWIRTPALETLYSVTWCGLKLRDVQHQRAIGTHQTSRHPTVLINVTRRRRRETVSNSKLQELIRQKVTRWR
jgi:hypothetical protein